MLKSRQLKQGESLQDRIATWANNLREQADKLPDGPERDALLKKLRQADTVSNIEGWAYSTGLAAHVGRLMGRSVFEPPHRYKMFKIVLFYRN
jgi:hypothetical protein